VQKGGQERDRGVSIRIGVLWDGPVGRLLEEELMSSAVSANPPGGLREEPELTSAKDQQKARALGLTSATGLVIGTVIGAGVFTMPAVLASAGIVSLAVLAVIAVGAMVLAVLFGQLSRRIPNADGGLYAYARHEFGDFAGYLTGWCYWIQAWAGNAAIVSSWVFYVDAWGRPSSGRCVNCSTISTGRGWPSTWSAECSRPTCGRCGPRA
jgi:amino acid permease